MSRNFSIGKVEFSSTRTAVIAEAGVNHLGRMDYAESLIKGAKVSGADIIKFQTYKASRLTTKDAPRFWNWEGEVNQDGSQFDSYSRLDSFGLDEYRELKKMCEDYDIEFMSTPFDTDSVDLLEEVGVSGYKVASCDITNKPLLAHIAKTQKPILLSTGAANLAEITRTVTFLSELGCEDLLIMHCTLTYPTPAEDSNMLAISTLRDLFPEYLVGHSDHTLGIDIAATGTILGSSALEKHFTFDKTLPLSADHWLSLDVDDMTALVKRIRTLESARGDGIKATLESEELARRNARRSIVTSKPLNRGHVLTIQDLEFKRPGTGIEPWDFESLIGRTINKNLEGDHLLGAEDFENL